MKPLVIYHGNCADGFGAAWVLWKYFGGNVDFFPGVYQRPPPAELFGRDVIMVDFSYKRAVLDLMLDRVNSLLILDHHKTAEADLSDWPRVDHYGEWTLQCEAPPDNIAACFDMERSGAGIAWDFFFPGKPRPPLLNVIEDRDLWRFALGKDYTRRIQASLFSFPYDFQLWDQLMTRPLESLELDGIAIERKHFKDIEELIQVVTRPMRFKVPVSEKWPEPYNTMVVPVANLPYTMTSDAGHMLCERSLEGRPSADGTPYKHPFAACYWDKPDGRQFSLRSQDDGADVGEIAKLYGGGGHAHASGFTVPYDRLAEFEP